MGLNHSHSIVPGGLLVTPYTTRFPLLHLVDDPRRRFAEEFVSKEWKSAVMPSVDVTARRPTTYS